MKQKVAFKTLGCRLNQFESDSILTDFYKAGYEIVDFSQPADVYVINTCTVTSQGDHKSRTAINKAVKSNKGSLVVVTGCMVESQRPYLQSRDDLSYIIDNKSKSDLLSIVDAHFNGEIVSPELLRKDIFGFSVAEKSLHTRSMIKIQDGCDNYCTYCIVPLVRGNAVSRPLNDIIENIRQVTVLGYKEIILTGVNISRYENNGTDFTGLLRKILIMEGNFRVRISSIEPEGLDESFYDLFHHEKLCPHLHLSLQSGSDRILKRMGRTYDYSSFLEITDTLRARIPLFNFTTDVIVGFPGESETDFEKTCKAVQEIGFSHVHTFKYSVRKGTKAENMTDQIPEKVKQNRSLVIREITKANKFKFRQSLIGMKQNVLVEKINRSGLAIGYGQHYVPVEFRPVQKGNNYFETVTITGFSDNTRDYILTGITGAQPPD
jgi:threonylcarbamoyladenosine tRNA methylthiotransferase MtaB